MLHDLPTSGKGKRPARVPRLKECEGHAEMHERLLSCDELIAVLDGWVGQRVAVRVVSEANDLLTVSHGVLGERSPAKHPSVWWPLDDQAQDAGYEAPGIWLHPEHFARARLHSSRSVVEFEHSGVEVNLRRLERRRR